MHRVHLDLNVHLRSHRLHTHRPITPSILTDLAYLLAYPRWGRRRLTSINIDEITNIGMYHTCHVQSVELLLNVPSPPPIQLEGGSWDPIFSSDYGGQSGYSESASVSSVPQTSDIFKRRGPASCYCFGPKLPLERQVRTFVCLFLASTDLHGVASPLLVH